MRDFEIPFLLAKPLSHDGDQTEMWPVRRQHPGMLDADDLKPDLTIRCHWQDGSTSHYRLTSGPSERTVEAVHLGPSPLHQQARDAFGIPSPQVTLSLADMGMQPYSPNHWNPTNYVTADEPEEGSR